MMSLDDLLKRSHLRSLIIHNKTPKDPCAIESGTTHSIFLGAREMSAVDKLIFGLSLLKRNVQTMP